MLQEALGYLFLLLRLRTVRRLLSGFMYNLAQLCTWSRGIKLDLPIADSIFVRVELLNS